MATEGGRASRHLWWILLCSPLVLLVAGYGLASYRWSVEEQAWSSAGESFDDFAARYPRRAASEGVARLNALTRTMGIESMRGTGAATVDPAQAKALREAMSYVSGLTKLEDDRGRPERPASLDAFLEKQASTLDAIEDLLISGAPIEWEQDVSQGLDAPIPPLVGIRELQSVLLVRSLEASDHGHPDAAARALEAAWKHADSLSLRPDLMSQLMALMAARHQNGVLRLLRKPSAVWKDRFAARDYRRRFDVAYRNEAQGERILAEQYMGLGDFGTGPSRGAAGAALRVVSAPYVRMSLANASKVMRTARAEIAGADLCSLDPAATAGKIEAAIPHWDVLGRSVPNLFRAWGTVRERMLDDERTALIVDARSSSGAPPADRPSSVCPAVTWTIRPEADGRLAVAASAALPFSEGRPDGRFVFGTARH
jgi:hypothetical protein